VARVDGGVASCQAAHDNRVIDNKVHDKSARHPKEEVRAASSLA
jgi:hypothetical protein